MTQFSRRQLLGGGLSAATLGMLTACSTPGQTSVNAAPTLTPAASGEKITLTYWSWLNNLQKVADIWNKANPYVQVETVWIPSSGAGAYQKMYSALATSSGPDIAQIEMRSIPEFMMVNGLVDLNRYGAADSAHLFDPTLWNQVSFNGGVYGVPQDSGPMGMYYQPAVLDQVGATPPATWDEWLEVATELRKNEVYIDCFPIGDAAVFGAYATQAGANWLRPEEDGWVINMTDPATMATAEFFDRAIDKDLVQTSFGNFTPGWFAAASKGTIASAVSASWADALIAGVGGGEGKWRVAPMPTWGHGGYGSSYLGGSTAAVLANSKHPKEALEFAVWLMTSQEGLDGLIDNCGIGWSPARDFIGTSRQQPSKFFSGQNYGQEIFEPAVQQQNTDWSWWPVTTQSFNILSDGFRKKASGTPLVESVADAESQIMTVFKNKGLNIRKETS